jgi:hypothetical protein
MYFHVHPNVKCIIAYYKKFHSTTKPSIQFPFIYTTWQFPPILEYMILEESIPKHHQLKIIYS